MSTSDDQPVKTATAFVIMDTDAAAITDSDAQMMDDATSAEAAETSITALPDRLRKRLLAERKCRPTNEQLDQKLARAEQRRQKQVAKRAASAREAEARCRRVAEAMEALHARRPESRAQVVQRYTRLRHDLQEVLGRFNSEVERTNCALFAGAPLLAFGGGLGYSPSSSGSASTTATATTTTAARSSSFADDQNQHVHRPGTAFVVGHSNGNDDAAVAAAASAAANANAEMPARLRQRLAAYPRRRGRQELKKALENKLADAQRRKERYEQRRAKSVKEMEERCRQNSETMEEISLQGRQGPDSHLHKSEPLLAFGGGLGYSPSSTGSSASTTATATTSSFTDDQHQRKHLSGTAFVVGHSNGNDDAAVAAAAAANAAANANAEMPARLRQRLAAYPRRRGRHELKTALENKLADAQRRKERYEQRRAESIRETEERCRRISETMEEISLQVQQGPDSQLQESEQQQQEQQPLVQQQQTRSKADNGSGSRVFYRRVAKLQVDLDCLFTKFNREIVTVRGRPVDLLETLEWPPMPPVKRKEISQEKKQASIACQTDIQVCNNCGQDPNADSV